MVNGDDVAIWRFGELVPPFPVANGGDEAGAGHATNNKISHLFLILAIIRITVVKLVI